MDNKPGILDWIYKTSRKIYPRSNKSQEKAEYETKPRSILNIKKLEIKGKPEKNKTFIEKNFSLDLFPRVPILMTNTLCCTQEAEKWSDLQGIQNIFFWY